MRTTTNTTGTIPGKAWRAKMRSTMKITTLTMDIVMTLNLIGSKIRKNFTQTEGKVITRNNTKDDNRADIK